MPEGRVYKLAVRMQLLQGGVQTDRTPFRRAETTGMLASGMCWLTERRACLHKACAGWQNGVHARMRHVRACRTACTRARGMCGLAERRACVHEAYAGLQNGVQECTREVHASRASCMLVGP